MLRIAIVDPSDFTRDPLRSLLLGVDFVWLESECSRYEFFADVIRQSLPDLAIVVLDSDRNRGLNTVSQLVSMYPNLPILTISSDHQSLLQSLQRGARYFLTQPVALEELMGTLGRVHQDFGIASQEGGQPIAFEHSHVISVMGSRGGVGCTSLAVNLACTLAADPNNSVVLIDLDLALGDADIALDMMADHTIADLALNIERLDMNFMKRSMLKHESTGLFLLAHPLQISDVNVIREDHVVRVINLLRISHTHLVLDLSKCLMPTDLAALRLSDQVLLMAQLDLASLRNVVRILMSMSMDDELSERVRIVLNRVGSDFAEADISLKKAEETVGKPIFWQIPNDTKAMIGSRVAGVPLIQHAPKCKAQQSIAGLADALFGRTPAGAPQQAQKASGFFSRMVGR